MTDEDYQIVLHYHDATKHHPQRYARSLGYLDWATQPNPFRRFAGSPLLPLPIPNSIESPSYEAIFVAGAVQPRPLDVASISEFFYLSLSISAWKQAGQSRWALRCNPSSGNLHPTEGYAVFPAITGLHDKPAVYHYAAREHGLERRCEFEDDTWQQLMEPFPSGSFLVGLSSIYWREAWKYGERAFRYCQHDAGHALAALRIAAATLGWRIVLLEDLSDEEIAHVLGLDRDNDFRHAEREQPEMLAVVIPDTSVELPRDLNSEAINMIANGTWTGHANKLSAEHAVDWEIIDKVAEAARKPHTQTKTLDIELDVPPIKPIRTNLSAFQIIRQRRSALAFDGETSIGEDAFYHMLMRVLPPAIPFDAIHWRPRIDLFLFVHLVNGLSPGLYVLVRDPQRLTALKKSCDAEFLWKQPARCPAHLPLYLLTEADCRQAAAQLSLGQEIAGMSAFALSMVAHFDASLTEYGPWFYRHLYWEAGIVGQVLYLEAEAAGIRATGIGAYFDDLVHEAFGMRDHRFQSLYHFTVGGHVEDKRLTTLPSYPAPELTGTFDAP